MFDIVVAYLNGLVFGWLCNWLGEELDLWLAGFGVCIGFFFEFLAGFMFVCSIDLCVHLHDCVSKFFSYIFLSG